MKPRRLFLEWLTSFLHSIAILEPRVSGYSKVERTCCKIECACLLSKTWKERPTFLSLQVVVPPLWLCDPHRCRTQRQSGLSSPFCVHDDGIVQSSFPVGGRANPYMFYDMTGAVTVNGIRSCRFLAWKAVATTQFCCGPRPLVDHLLPSKPYLNSAEGDSPH